MRVVDGLSESCGSLSSILATLSDSGDNEIINGISKRAHTTSIISLIVGDEPDKDNKEIASSMNEFFCSIGNRLIQNIPEKPNLLLSN